MDFPDITSEALRATQRGDHAVAVDKFAEALDLQNALGKRPLRSLLRHLVFLVGRWPVLRQALVRMYPFAGTNDESDNHRLGLACFNLGQELRKIDRWEQAFDIHGKGLAHRLEVYNRFKSNQTMEDVAESLNAYGDTLADRGSLVEAMQFLEQGKVVLTNSAAGMTLFPDSHPLVTTLDFTRAKVLSKMGMHPEAIDLFYSVLTREVSHYGRKSAELFVTIDGLMLCFLVAIPSSVPTDLIGMLESYFLAGMHVDLASIEHARACGDGARCLEIQSRRGLKEVPFRHSLHEMEAQGVARLPIVDKVRSVLGLSPFS